MRKKTRRQFSREYKLEAVTLMQRVGSEEAGKSLGVHPNTLHAWRRKLQAEGDSAFPGNGKVSGEEGELKRLRAEVRKLRQEKEILKKAAAFFVKEGA